VGRRGRSVVVVVRCTMVDDLHEVPGFVDVVTLEEVVKYRDLWCRWEGQSLRKMEQWIVGIVHVDFQEQATCRVVVDWHQFELVDRDPFEQLDCEHPSKELEKGTVHSKLENPRGTIVLTPELATLLVKDSLKHDSILNKSKSLV